MSSGPGATPPMHFCYECGMEVRPLMTPQPTCPRCNGGFLEELESSRAGQEEDEDEEAGDMGTAPFWNSDMDSNAQGPGLDIGQLMASIVRGLAAAGQDRASPQTRNSATQRAGSDPSASQINDPLGADQANGRQGEQAGGSSSNAPQGQFRTGTTRIGPVNVSWGVGSQQGTMTAAGSTRFGNDPRFDDGMGGAGGAADGRFFNHDNSVDSDGDDGEQNVGTRLGGDGRRRPAEGRGEPDLPPELASLRDIFGNLFGGIEDGPGGMLMDMLGGALRGGGGRSGDYVWGQQGLDDVITQLMDASRGTTAPPPATEEAIAKLDTFTRKAVDKVRSARNEECPTCMDTFLEEEQRGPQDASKDSNALSSDAAEMELDDPPEVVPMEEQQDELIMMPCRHLFHQDCLVPWLKSSGTCPVCRITLDTKAPHPSDAAASSGPSSSRAATGDHPLAAQPSTLSSARDDYINTREDTDIEDSDDEGDDSPAQRRDRMRRAAERRQQQGQSPQPPGAFVPTEDLD